MLGQKKACLLANRSSCGKPSKKIKWDIQDKKIQRQMLNIAKLIGTKAKKSTNLMML